jgi:hypothetical protein
MMRCEIEAGVSMGDQAILPAYEVPGINPIGFPRDLANVHRIAFKIWAPLRAHLNIELAVKIFAI